MRGGPRAARAAAAGAWPPCPLRIGVRHRPVPDHRRPQSPPSVRGRAGARHLRAARAAAAGAWLRVHSRQVAGGRGARSREWSRCLAPCPL